MAEFVKMESIRIMGVIAHADDELSFAGLLTKIVSNGGEGVILCFTGNSRRKEEFFKSCSLIGVKGYFLGYPDLGMRDISFKKELVRLVKLIRGFKPHIIATVSEMDYHPDHKAVLELVKDAVEFASHGTRETGWLARRILMFESENLDPNPDHLISIDSELQKKMDILDSYASQVSAPHKKGYYSSQTLKLAELRGIMAGCRYAEACRELKMPIHGRFYCTERRIDNPEDLLR